MNRRAAERRWRDWLRRRRWRSPGLWPTVHDQARMMATSDALGVLRRRWTARHGAGAAAGAVWDYVWRRAARTPARS